ncbi:nonsense-mediated mRNA decay factor SMG8 [Hemicordylus capensis]|uniref:nonsense-mediated mRNA decay factor SMG8 n=1 Tax=Hemicordylus capensis TaxID=884348 RepID=UPI0023021559|nr:nonsense-mediated mRNA decay factor SMG8 [Hemicordylus capensis]
MVGSSSAMQGPVRLHELLLQATAAGAEGASSAAASAAPPNSGSGSGPGTGVVAPGEDEEVCVVGIFGKTALQLSWEKAALVNTVCDRQVFPLFPREGEPGTPPAAAATATPAASAAAPGEGPDPGEAASPPPPASPSPSSSSSHSSSSSASSCSSSSSSSSSQADYNLLQAYYSQECKVLYLVLSSICDSRELLRACQELEALGGAPLPPHAEAHAFWKQQEKRHCLRLLYLFSVCHVLLLAHPTCSFDVTYDRVFRALDGLRQKVLPSLRAAIKDCPVGKDWKLNCRPCPPRLLFLFQLNGALKVEPPPSRGGLDAGCGGPPEKPPPKKHSPKRRLQHALEDQIYRIFRKSRVLTNQSVNCLFTVPANQAFVYIVAGGPQGGDDPIATLLDQLRGACTAREAEAASLGLAGPRRYQLMRPGRPPLSFQAESGHGGAGGSSSGQLVDCTLREFLFQHVELVLGKKGFDDSVGRNPQPSHFELPTYQKWVATALKLYEVAVEGKESDPASLAGELTSKILGSVKVLEGYLDIDTKFSENRCQKALPLAHSAYQSNLPHNYTMTVHKNQLAQALRVYSQHARGPAFHKYALQLHEDCYKFWSNGHQLCEERSLTDQHCVHKFHLLPKAGEKPEPDRNPPVLYHNSRARSTGACNCGRKQAPRDDPFDIKAANYDFYQLLEEKCCGKLDHINFPIFQPSTPDPAPAKNETSPSPPEGEAEKLKEKEPQTQGESTSLSLALSLGQSTDSLGTYPADPQGGGNNAEAHGQVTDSKGEKRPSLVDRQASTVEYLPGMLHSNCPKGLLPKFSSWSLVKLGPAKAYNFHTGLDQQGFILGTNYLMPWDIVIRTRTEEEGDLDTNSWPAPNKAIPGKRSAVVMGRGRRRDDVARAFVGFEYEDARGRRFMCSGPEKIMKVMGGGPKESALKALNSDMPLYILSSNPGRGLKPHYAQLMRLFVVVPDAPLQITMTPQVQPGPPPCPVFYPEKQEITLPPDGLWVLRFPYAYVTERGPCFPPKENQQLMTHKVLRGVLKAVIQ